MDELETFERRLRRTAAARAQEASRAGTGELGSLLAHVAERRRGRSGAGPDPAGELGLTTQVESSPTPPTPPSSPTPSRLGELSLTEPRVAEPQNAEPRDSQPQSADQVPTSLIEPSAAATSPAAEPWSGPPGQVLSIEQVAADVRILRIGRPASFEYRAGQYMKMGIEGRRSGSFSLSSAPHEPHLEFCIERIPGGRLTPAMFTLSVGSRVVLGERAKGSLRLDPAARTHLLVATVTGIAPVRSLVLQALRDRVPSRLLILHGASLVDELPYADELTALAAAHPRLSYLPTVSRPGDARNAGWSGATGRVDEQAIRAASSLDPSSTQVLATGNAGMIANVRTALGGRGFTVDTEAFD